jgi:hypothetical protein
MSKWSVTGLAVMAALVAGVFLPGAALAQDKPAADKVEATILEIKGVVDVKRPADADFIEGLKDMKLAEDSEISTGLDSEVTLLFPPENKVVVKSLTQVKIDKLLIGQGTVETKLKLQTGTVKVEVNKGDMKTDLKVATPNTTASISGTQEEVTSYEDSGDEHDVTEGTVIVQENQGEGEDEGEDEGEGLPVEEGESTNENLDNPVDGAIDNTQSDTNPEGLTEQEQQILTDMGDGSTGSTPGDANSDVTNPANQGGTGGSTELPEPPSPPGYPY